MQETSANVGGGLESGVPSALSAEPLHLTQQMCLWLQSPPYAVRTRVQPIDPYSLGCIALETRVCW